MTTDDGEIAPGSEAELAIERALEAANLRAGGATATTTSAAAIAEVEPSAAEAGDVADFDAD